MNNITTKFAIGQEVFWFNHFGDMECTFAKGIIDEIKIDQNITIMYHIREKDRWGNITNDWIYKDEANLFDSFEALELTFLLKKKIFLEKELKNVTDQLEKYVIIKNE